MVKEIYFRDPSDIKFKNDRVEVYSDLELLLNKIRMILMTKRGEVLGEPDLGLDLEDMLFEFSFDENKIRQSFYAQIQKYVYEQNTYKIDLDISVSSEDNIRTVIYLFVKIDGVTFLGLKI